MGSYHFHQMSCLFHWLPQLLVAKGIIKKKKKEIVIRHFQDYFRLSYCFKYLLHYIKFYVTLAQMVKAWCSWDQEKISPWKDVPERHRPPPHRTRSTALCMQSLVTSHKETREETVDGSEQHQKYEGNSQEFVPAARSELSLLSTITLL